MGTGSSGTFTDSTFVDTQAADVHGGGLAMFMFNARAEFVRCSISNTTSSENVFVFLEGSSLSIVDSVIANITRGSVIIDDRPERHCTKPTWSRSTCPTPSRRCASPARSCRAATSEPSDVINTSGRVRHDDAVPSAARA